MDNLNNGERQVAPTLAGIRRDHVARYEFAAQLIGSGRSVLDIACGVGYGSAIIARTNFVTGVDRSAEAIAYAHKHYYGAGINFQCMDADDAAGFDADRFDVAVCFETIEHIRDPLPMLKALRACAKTLIASVPNEDAFPHGGRILHHFRHYRPSEFVDLLARAGWRMTDYFTQIGPESEIEPGSHGRTIIVTAERAELPQSEAETDATKVPDHVLILGLGPSLESFVDIAKRLGGRHVFCDEVWGINAVGGVLQCDRIFHMDDVRIQMARAAAMPESNIARMLEWMRRHPGPIYTSRTHEDFPGLVAYPLEDVINSCGWAYFNSTAAYAVAYAVHIGVKKISLFGCDFSYASSHHAEKGRGCVEFHLGIASQRGIEIGFPAATSLMDANAPIEERIYGYDTIELGFEDTGERHVVTMVPRAETPTAAEIEARYDHSQPTNRMVQP